MKNSDRHDESVAGSPARRLHLQNVSVTHEVVILIFNLPVIIGFKLASRFRPTNIYCMHDRMHLRTLLCRVATKYACMGLRILDSILVDWLCSSTRNDDKCKLYTCTTDIQIPCIALSIYLSCLRRDHVAEFPTAPTTSMHSPLQLRFINAVCIAGGTSTSIARL